MSWDDDFLGARASRPHKTWHSFAYLLHFDQPGTAPLPPFRLADAVPADKVAACRIALKLSGASRGRCVSGAGGRLGRNRMRAGRPRSQAITPPSRGESQKPSRQAKADAVGGGRRAVRLLRAAMPRPNAAAAWAARQSLPVLFQWTPARSVRKAPCASSYPW